MGTRGPTPRILVVDDDPGMRHLVWLTLRPLGARLAVCTGPSEAMERLRSEPFDLLVTDHDMPGESGLDLVRRVRRESGNPNAHVRVVVMSAFDAEAHREALVEAGVAAVVSKPFRPSELRMVVSMLLPESALGSAIASV